MRQAYRRAKSGTTSQNTHVFDHSWQRERDRLRGIESLPDSSTRRIPADRGVRPGWSCLEVGRGAGGVAIWLAEQVGSSGHVPAIDLDTRFVDAGPDNLEVRQPDLVTDELERGAFDLVHARAVLEHIPQREIALERMIAALKPGGWLVIEDVDFGGAMTAAASRYFHPARLAELAGSRGRIRAGRSLAAWRSRGSTTTPESRRLRVPVTLSASRGGTCRILTLTLEKLHLTLLGLNVDLSKVNLTVTG
jgi:2-polyprenyl-3-methyl-5-hydroxy-6-metoxy-1,4-benzoquinol methylase